PRWLRDLLFVSDKDEQNEGDSTHEAAYYGARPARRRAGAGRRRARWSRRPGGGQKAREEQICVRRRQPRQRLLQPAVGDGHAQSYVLREGQRQRDLHAATLRSRHLL